MITKDKKVIYGLTTLAICSTLINAIGFSGLVSPKFEGKIIHNESVKKIEIKSAEDILNEIDKSIEAHKEKIRIHELIKTQVVKSSRNKVSRGGEYIRRKEITVFITYYTNKNTRMQGGHYDKRGELLTSHEENICAMPKDVPYGSMLIVENLGEFKVVDTGGRIKWLNKEKTKCKVDVFIPNVSEKWIIENTENTTRKAVLYY